MSAHASASETENAVVVDRSSHSISRRRIPENVLKVLYRLHRSGYRAYLCGGSVRDLLTNRAPKDFDVATDAHPMEIRRLFRNSRIIGRRFRLVHIIFQDMIVELSTFRRGWARGAFRLMVDAGLLEPLLPEVYRTIVDDKAPYFWKMLEVLDRTVQAGRKISDAVLLSVLLLPWITEELESEEERRPNIKIPEVLVFIRELIQPLVTRMSLSAGTRHQIEQTLETMWRLLELPTDKRASFRFVFREPFNDALALLELYALSSGREVEAFRQWQSFATRAKRTAEDAAPPPRRRRRRRG